MFRKLPSVIILLFVVASFGISGCLEEKVQPVDPEIQIIYDGCKELFTRIKVRDYEGIWDFEYPYLYEERSLASFLGDNKLQYYKPDTLLAIEIDSIIMRGVDSALCHMKLEWLLADSSVSTQNIALGWYKVDGRWCKPTVSRAKKQREFEEEMQMYWDAVRAIEEREANEAKEEAKSAGSDGN